MRFSVVVNTYNRGPSLRKTLESLRHQVYEDFEVVVVNGPSGDSTAEVLAAFDGLVRVVECPEVHLSKSRNLGIEAAAGEVVAFIDDDAIPEPHWLADLAAAYADPRVCGAGGLVYDHTGVRYQYQYSVCDRLGSPRFETKPPPAECSRPGADPFVYLQGTNCSFRRDCLVAVGGFDEEIEYYLDETEVCLQMADHGFPLRPLPRAAVHHKYLASHIRNPNRRVLDPFSTVKNACYFALLHGRRTRPLREVLDYLSRYLGAVRDGAERAHAMGEITAPQLDHFLRRADEGVEVGIDRGLHQQRRRRRFPPRPAGEFLRFPTLRPDGRRLTVCFLSQEYPPGEFGGIGRLYHDLATGFAARGHEVHVVTRSPDDDRVDFEEGVWVHRLVPREPRLAELDAIPLGGNLRLIASRYY
ncbi:MAG TPA: glycosyltransferase, partial [Gemmataceae bacterium]